MEVDTPVQCQWPLRLKKSSVSQRWTTDLPHHQSRSYSEAIPRQTVASSGLRRLIHNSSPSSLQKLKEETNSSPKFKEKSTSPCGQHSLHYSSSSPTILLTKVQRHSWKPLQGSYKTQSPSDSTPPKELGLTDVLPSQNPLNGVQGSSKPVKGGRFDKERRRPVRTRVPGPTAPGGQNLEGCSSHVGHAAQASRWEDQLPPRSRSHQPQTQ